MDRITEAVVTILTAIVGVSILAVLVSQRSNTAGVLTAAGSAFSGMLGTAVSPVTGSSSGMNMPAMPSMPGISYR
jgi:hypothetical protein